MRRKAIFSVSVGGADVTGNLSAYVTEITVNDASGQTADTASITLADDGGRILMPSKGDQIAISLGWEGEGVRLVFEGKIEEVTSTGARGGGRMLSITAKSADTESKVKEHREKHYDDKTLGDVMKDAGQHAGVAMSVHPSLASIKRDYWGMAGQSFIAFGDKIAREVGGTFKIRGKRGTLVPRGEGIGANGSALPTITGRWGGNLISWSIAPARGRPRFRKFVTRYYDRKEAKWKREEVDAAEQVEPQSTDRYSEADAGTAKNRAKASKKGGEREKGGGSASIDGDPSAQAEAMFVLIGARPGVDGSYRIDSVEHKYVRGGGYTTSLQLKQPSGDSGKDSRGK
jgi:phage protein D